MDTDFVIVAFGSEADIFSCVFVVPLSNGIRSRSRQTREAAQ